MIKTKVNPWEWQAQYQFSQAWRVEDGKTLIFVSGQASIGPDGNVHHEHDFEAQCRLTFENLKRVLADSGASLEDVVKLGIFLLDPGRLPDFNKVRADYFDPEQWPADTVLGVTGLAGPEMQVEVEAYAVV